MPANGISQNILGVDDQKRWLWPLLLAMIIALNVLVRFPTIFDNPIVVISDERDVVVSALWPEKNYKYGDFLGTAFRYPLLVDMKLNDWELEYEKYAFHEAHKYFTIEHLRAKRIIRFENFLIMCMALILTYAIARHIVSPAWALVAVGLFALSPVFSAYSRIAKSDGLLTFLILLSVWLALLGLRSGFRYLVLATIAAGLAFGVKFSAPAALVPALALMLIHEPQRRFRKFIMQGLILATVWILTVLIFFPDIFHALKQLPQMVTQYAFPLPSHLKIVPHKVLYTYIISTLIFFLPFSIGWITAPLGVLGMISLGHNKNNNTLVFLAFPISHLVLFEFVDLRVWNNMLPVAPFIAISACFFTARLIQKRFTRIAVCAIALAICIEVYGSSRIYKQYPCTQRALLEAGKIVGEQYTPEAVKDGDLCVFLIAFQNHKGSEWQNDIEQLDERLGSDKCEWIVAMTSQFDANRKFGGPIFTRIGEFPDRIKTGQTSYSGYVMDCSYPTSTIAEWLDPAYHDEDFFFVVRRGGIESTQTTSSGWRKFGLH